MITDQAISSYAGPERASFEQMMQDTCGFGSKFFTRNPDGKYANMDVGWAWIGWYNKAFQAAAT